MNRSEIIRFYENKIDDIKDEEKREGLLDKLEELEDMMLELDTDIEEEIDKQETKYINDYDLANEFNYMNRMPA